MAIFTVIPILVRHKYYIIPWTLKIELGIIV